MPAHTSKREVALLIRSFLDGSIDRWDWDDFTSIRQADPQIEEIRQRLSAIYDEFPATETGHYCNPEGITELRRIAEALNEIEDSNSHSLK